MTWYQIVLAYERRKLAISEWWVKARGVGRTESPEDEELRIATPVGDDQ